jgi:plastocyanin
MDIFSQHTRSRGNTVSWIIGFVAVIGLVVLAAYGSQYFGAKPASDEREVKTENSENNAAGTVPEGMDIGNDFPAERADTGTENLGQEVRTFEVHGSMFKYDLKELRVREGEVVKIVFINDEGFHDWVLDEFDVRTEKIGAGKTAEVTFTASKKGTFEYYCSVGTHRAQGMKGTLIVE